MSKGAWQAAVKPTDYYELSGEIKIMKNRLRFEREFHSYQIFREGKRYDFLPSQKICKLEQTNLYFIARKITTQSGSHLR